MFRTFCGSALTICLCSCVCFPTDYVVKKEGEEVAVYKPGTLFKQVDRAEEVWIKIPMVRVEGCSDGRFEFNHRPSKVSWSLKTEWFGETTVRFRPEDLKDIAANKRPHTLLHDATATSTNGCRLVLGPDSSAIPKTASSAINFPRQLLDILVAERLPTTATSSWIDQYDFDKTTHSINIVPGMRIRINPELPFTADSSNAAEPHPGILAAPIYLELAAAGPEDPGRGQWSKFLEPLGFNQPDSVRLLGTQQAWRSVSGLNDLDSQARFWRLFVPDRMSKPEIVSPVEPCDTDCVNTNLIDVQPPLLKGDTPEQRKTGSPKTKLQVASAPFIQETFWSDFDGYPGFTLVGSVTRAKLEEMLRTMGGNIGAHGPNLTEACNGVVGTVDCIVFRYRAVISLEIPVLVNREMVWIEPGTTVFDLLQHFSAGQLQGHFSSPLAGKDNEQDRKDILETLMRLRRDQHWERASKDLTLMRRFEGDLVQVSATSKSNAALLEVVLQTGDEITWSR